jgi:hypothetical protein
MQCALSHKQVKCFKPKATYLGSGYIQPNNSSLLRKINAIKVGRGKFVIAPIVLNVYGKKEGSLGGYGSSPKNRFS